jgi:hypothetical protein
MYRTCLFCIGELGTNEVLEALPVGRIVAFDPGRGRLWVVCPECNRWNLTPLEERWEAVEMAERLFHDSHRRVTSENVGVALLPDGTRLIRVGQVLPAEYASWRYGRQIRGRSGRATGAARRVSDWLGSLVTGTILAPGVFDRWSVIHRLDGEGARAVIRRGDLDGAEFETGPASGLVHFRLVRPAGGVSNRALEGHSARTLLERMLLNVNREASPERLLNSAVRFLERHPTGADLFQSLGEGHSAVGPGRLRLHYEGEGQWRGEWAPAGVRGFQAVPRYRTVALEMALHEEAERRALEGELRELVHRWKEAETIARIADSLD